jgi:uncharacterized protein YdeI (YjbR/CyaY-like superfamily)
MNPHKSAGMPGVLYNDAVEESLCFGWIDSNVRNINKDYSAQRYTPRKSSAPYSQANIERLKLLAKQGKLAPDIRVSTASILRKRFVFSQDILAAIGRSAAARDNFKQFPAAYNRVRVVFIEGARKRPDAFKTRLAYFIRMCEKGRMFGYVGIEKYFR